jgi:hypothetical protein
MTELTQQDECPPTGVPPMTDNRKPSPGPSYKLEVGVKSNYPVQNAVYDIDMYDDITFMVMQNAAFTLVAAVMAKLGRILSEYEITGDISATKAAVNALMEATKGEAL